MQKFETHASQLSLVGGIRQQVSDMITVAEPRSPLSSEARKGILYILVEAEVTAPRSQQICLLAAQTVRRAFYENPTFSITAAMRRAIAAANKAIYEQNISQSAGKRATVGITVAVLKGSDLFIAQVQPAQIYVLSEGTLRALPSHPSWDPAHFSVAPFTRSGALGASLFIDPEMYRCALLPNESVILCTSGFSQLLSRDETNSLLHLQDTDAAVERLLCVANEHNVGNAHALVIELRPSLSPVTPQVTPVPVIQTTRSLRGWLASLTSQMSLAISRQQPSPAKDGPPSPDPLYTLPVQPQYPANPLPRPVPITMGEDLGTRYSRLRQERERRKLKPEDTYPELPPSSYLGENSFATTTRRIDLGDGPALAAKARPYRSRYEMRPLIDLNWSERLALPFRMIGLSIDEARRNRRIRPNTPPPVVRGQGLSYRRTRPAFPWLLLISLILIVSILFVYGMSLTSQNDQMIALEYFTAAEGRLATVREAANEADALNALELARQAINELQTNSNVTDTNPQFWLRYQELQREYERALAAVQRLTFFDTPTVLSTHTAPNGTFSDIIMPPATAVVTNPILLDAMRYLYVLDGDKTNTRLYRILRDGGTPQIYLSPNEPVGSSVVGPLRASLWRTDQVVAIDQAPSGFGYYFRNGNVWNYSKLGSSEIWSVRDRLIIKEYDSNIYIWGALPNEVLKFRSGSYDNTPEYWLDPASLSGVDINGVVDMAVNGEIYLLKPNGNVLIFSQGRLVSEIKPEAINPPITAASRFFMTDDGSGGGSIFLIEKQNERIIQMDKNTGKVIQQTKTRPDSNLRLNQLDGIAVVSDGAQSTLYLVNGGQIIRADLPAPPRSFRDQGAQPTPAVP